MERAGAGWAVGLALLLAGALAWGAPVVRWDFEDASGWEMNSLWRFVEARELSGESSEVRNFPSPPTAAYFGVVDPRSGRGSYDTRSRVEGELRSPWVAVGAGQALQPGDLIGVKFRYYRQVERYSGPYDRTSAHLYFRNGAGRYWNPTAKVWQAAEVGVEVFYRDSSHPCPTAWEEFTFPGVEVPAQTEWVRVVFRFDSVDHVNNHYLGWLVDNVEFHRTGAPLAIVTQTLPDAREGEWYYAVLEGKGGTPPYAWAVAQGSRLPAGLSLNRATGEITGTPTEAGGFEVEFVLTDAGRGERRKRVGLLVWRARGQGMLLFSHRFSAGLSGWSADGLWHHGGWAEIGPGAYYAVPGAGNYDTGRRTFGQLRSPEVDVAAQQGKDLEVWFAHSRGVEFYAGGGYDKTYVDIRFQNAQGWGEWTTVWYKDSRDESAWPWTQEEIVRTRVPIDARRMQIRFSFDSVDGVSNGFPGWLVREVVIGALTGPLAISTTGLPPGELGVPYSATVEATGGQAGSYRWSATGLPDGLAIERDTGRIYGVSRKAGLFSVQVTVEDASGQPVSRKLDLKVESVRVTLFHEDFEEFVEGAKWLPRGAAAGLWKVVDWVVFGGTDIVPGRAAFYGQVPECSYDTGDKTTGALVSRPIELLDARFVKVSFDYWREVESYAGEFDQTYVQVRFGSGPWQTLWYKDSRNPSERSWVNYVSEGIAVPAGATTLELRFVFNTVDRHNNRYVGWLVDNVRVTKATSGAPLPVSAVPPAPERGAAGITVFNYPNPVRDVRTTTFAVRGVEAEAIRVEVYDLTGRLVYRAEAAGNEIVWHTDDLRGRYVANGVYLYRVYAKVGGVWVASDVQKLAILR